MIKYFFTKQFLGFLAVGGVAAFLHWISRIVLNNWMSFPFAVSISYVIGMFVAFTLNSFFVFPQSKKPRYQQALNFIVVNISFFPLVWGSSIVIDQILQELGMIFYTKTIAHGIAVALPMLATFLIYKFFAFKDAQYGRS